MAQTKSTLAEVLNEVPFDEGVLIGESTCKIPAALKSVAIEVTGGNLIKGCNGLDRAFLLVESSGEEKVLTVAAGENPPAVRKGLGKLEVTVGVKKLYMIPLDSSRHLGASGEITLTFEAGLAGKIALVVLKKGV